MEVLLLTDIPGIGRKNDLLIVKSGFALNHLLPERKALVVTPNVRRRYADHIKRRALERETEKQMQANLSAALAGKVLHLTSKASKAGKLYAALSESKVAEALKQEHGIEVATTSITLGAPIKSIGTHKATVTVGSQKSSITIEVKSDEVVETKETKETKKKAA